MSAVDEHHQVVDRLAGKIIGIIGGTGPQGRGLARRFADSGLQVVIGSRSADRAEAAAAELGSSVRGATNEDCAETADIVLVTVPWEGHRSQVEALAKELAGKVVVDCVNPLAFDKMGPFAPSVPEGSAAEQAQMLLADATVVAAFHHLSAVVLLDDEVASLDADVMVVGDDREATNLVQDLAGRIAGCRGVYAGRLRNAGQVEALTANLIAINKRYKAHASLRVTDI
ncbi:NADPH-dependent F420 reductase [Planosporangium thailandense]|uniref:NADPH-dependent F420 reductase n=1 Tax=Planosporangium thailandense TaxID=765197 RepID=A0ABX0Y1C4_9ACTN|nr:NADPH-dependent F420 reductase [Planosporangium thailandense]NJC71838.1 NADPH-dependent F420 reductase [Planosporangium thailandense]